MSQRSLALALSALFGLCGTALVWGTYAFCVLAGHDHQSVSVFRISFTAASWAPFAAVAIALCAMRIHWHLKPADAVIRIADAPTPLMAKFHEQDARLERRERLKGELFALNGEIETFNANLTPDERAAWNRRPGPYGK